MYHHTWKIETYTCDVVFWIPVLVSKCYFSDLTLNKFNAVWNLQTDKILVKISAGLLSIDIFNTSTSPSPMTCQILWNFTSMICLFIMDIVLWQGYVALWITKHLNTLFYLYPKSLNRPLSHKASLTLSSKTIYSAFVVDKTTTLWRDDLQLTVFSRRVNTTPLIDLLDPIYIYNIYN